MELITNKTYKIVFSDNGKDKAVFGKFIEEDEFFIKLIGDTTNELRMISKNRIITIQERSDKNE